MRVWVAWGVVLGWEFMVYVEVAFEVGKAFVKTPAFHAVFDA